MDVIISAGLRKNLRRSRSISAHVRPKFIAGGLQRIPVAHCG